MLAQTGTGEPPSGPGWIHEIKWDGIRAVAAWDGSDVVMRSRTGKEMARTYPEIAGAVRSLAPGIVLDGEIVTLDADGHPSFELLQQRMNLHSPGLVAGAAGIVPVSYITFDLPFQHESLVALDLETRIERLGNIPMPQGLVVSETYDDPAPLWAFARDRGLEGVLSKRRGSPYRPGVRSPDWLKSVAYKSLRAVVGGFTEGEGTRTGVFGALVLGLPADGGLRWIGSVGSGFSDSHLRLIREALDEMAQPDSPFTEQVDIPGEITWVAPSLVAVVQFKQWTSAGRLRGPSFKGFTDHTIGDVSWSSEGPDAPG